MKSGKQKDALIYDVWFLLCSIAGHIAKAKATDFYSYN